VNNQANKNIKLERMSFAIILLILFISIVDPVFKKRFLLVNIRASFKNGYGEMALPKEVIAMKNISNRHKEMHFRLSKNLANVGNDGLPAKRLNDAFILQRSVEYLYPTRLDDSNRYIFASKKDPDFLSCQIIDEEYEIAVYDCRK
jgi:hypothetical protein